MLLEFIWNAFRITSKLLRINSKPSFTKSQYKHISNLILLHLSSSLPLISQEYIADPSKFAAVAAPAASAAPAAESKKEEKKEESEEEEDDDMGFGLFD